MQWPAAFEEEVHGLPSNLDELGTYIKTPQLRAVEKPGDKALRPKFSKPTTSSQSGVEAYYKPLYWRHMNDVVQSYLDANADKRAAFKVTLNDVKYKMFVGGGDHGCGDQELRFAGIVHPLPLQNGIPGFQRFSMVSFFPPASGTIAKGFLDADKDDLHVYWRYEGVVLPGGNVILGRYHIGDAYRHWEDAFRRGPFIYWNVPDVDPAAVRAAAAATTAGRKKKTSDQRQKSTPEELEDEQEWISMVQAMSNGH